MPLTNGQEYTIITTDNGYGMMQRITWARLGRRFARRWATDLSRYATKANESAEIKVIAFRRGMHWVPSMKADTRTNVEFPRLGWQVACTWRDGAKWGGQLNGVTRTFDTRAERDQWLKRESGN